MARGEVTLKCPQCEFETRVPVAALRRDNYYCSRCGIRIPLEGVRTDPNDSFRRPAMKRKKGTYRGGRRR
jgi:uncharacterized paraquat-inducible protein A